MLNKTKKLIIIFHFMVKIKMPHFHFVGLFLVYQTLDSLFYASSTVNFSKHTKNEVLKGPN